MTQKPANKPFNSHHIQRSSLKPGPFVGWCMKCDKQGLTAKDMAYECHGIRTSQDEDLKRALDGFDEDA